MATQQENPMPAEDDDFDQEDQEQGQDDLRGLRTAARESKKNAEENALLRRKVLFLEAGIDTTSKLGLMLLKTFEGTDVEVLKAEAIEVGALKAPDPDPVPAVDPAREAQEAQRGQMYDTLTSGQPSGSTAPETEDPRDKALKGYQVAIRSGMDEDSARADAIGQVLAAASSGDRRVFYDKAKHHALAEEQNRLADSRPR